MSEFPLIVTRDMPKRAYREGRWLTVARAVPGTGQNTNEAAAELARVLYFGDPVVEGSKVIFGNPVDHYSHMGAVLGIEQRFGILFNKRFGPSFFGVRESEEDPLVFVKGGARYAFDIKPADTAMGVTAVEMFLSLDDGLFESIGFFVSRYMARRHAANLVMAQESRGIDMTRSGKSVQEQNGYRAALNKEWQQKLHDLMPEIANASEDELPDIMAVRWEIQGGDAKTRALMDKFDRAFHARQRQLASRRGHGESAGERMYWAIKAEVRSQLTRGRVSGRPSGHRAPELASAGYVPPKHRKAGFEVYDAEGNYHGFTEDQEEAEDYARYEVGPGAKVVDAKNRRKVLFVAESIREAGGQDVENLKGIQVAVQRALDMVNGTGSMQQAVGVIMADALPKAKKTGVNVWVKRLENAAAYAGSDKAYMAESELRKMLTEMNLQVAHYSKRASASYKEGTEYQAGPRRFDTLEEAVKYGTLNDLYEVSVVVDGKTVSSHRIKHDGEMK